MEKINRSFKRDRRLSFGDGGGRRLSIGEKENRNRRQSSNTQKISEEEENVPNEKNKQSKLSDSFNN